MFFTSFDAIFGTQFAIKNIERGLMAGLVERNKVMSKITDFKFRVYGRKYMHDDYYSVKFNKDGWHIGHIAICGQCEKDGTPCLYDNFRQDCISYPEGMKGDMEYLWEMYDADRITAAEVQDKLNKLGDWVDATGNARPNLWD